MPCKVTALEKDDWPENEEDRKAIEELMCEPWGDRRQELVFIGTEMDEVILLSRLESALLTDEELALGPEVWASWNCPLPLPSEEELTSEDNSEI